jgi:AcrR family transcriptional regulator
MKSLSANPLAPRGSRRQPDASRKAILQAALVEFAEEGLAGARVDAIAETAGVNKALLYYYFHDKESLYGAVLDLFFERLLDRVMTVCDRPGTAGERFLSYAKAHFDSIAESPYYAHIFMSELMSASSPSTFNRSACESSVCCKRASTMENFAPWTPTSSRRRPSARLFITF